MKITRFLLVLFLLPLLLHCDRKRGDVGAPCQNRGDCLADLRCGGGECYSPNAPVSSDELKKNVPCYQTPECRQYGRCSQAVGGSCIPSMEEHCKRSTVGCKRLKRCTYVPNVHQCCTDETGTNCNPVMGQKIRAPKKDPPPTPGMPSPP